jgi:hypothetical protein
MSQKARLRLYALLALPLFIGLFAFSDHIWIVFSLLALLVLAMALERCGKCGGALRVFGRPKEDADGRLLCHRCAGTSGLS